MAARKPAAPNEKSGRTESIINGEPALRLPHERDESSDSQDQGIRPIIKKAHDDLEAGLMDTDRRPPMDKVYEKQKEPPRNKRR